MDALKALNFDFWTFFLQAINLLIVIGILYILAYRPVTRMLLEREEQIEGALAHAARSRDEANALLAKYEEQIKGARNEAQEIIARATKLGEEIKEEIINSAKKDAAMTLAKARAEIEGEKAKALAEIRNEVAGLVVMAAGKVIEKELSPKDHERLINDFIMEAGEIQ
ncbi:MAG: F0F1 ATP synthase subunit B [Clostridia bacterium]|jgi:F-type H+-transporting ATPase subunit b|nr:F0F1 ATP synthase subunit B [Clostridia bacterium]